MPRVVACHIGTELPSIVTRTPGRIGIFTFRDDHGPLAHPSIGTGTAITPTTITTAIRTASLTV